MMYAVILAGGKGERLWPATEEHPKPFLPFGGKGRTLMRATYERLLPLVGAERIYVVAGPSLAPRVRAELGIPAEQLIVEPYGKNTAPAVGLAAMLLHRRDPQGTMAMLPADHRIEDEEAFRKALKAAERAAEGGYLVTLGIRPTYPATGYGYIEAGEELFRAEGHIVHRALRFVEKPDWKTAEEYLDRGNFFWNSGIFIWKLSRILEEIGRYLPGLHRALEYLRGKVGQGDWEEALREAYGMAEETSIDYGVMEKADRIATIPVSFGWNDLGDWHSIWEVSPKDGDGNASYAAQLLARDAKGNIVFSASGKKAALLGVSGLAVVEGPDSLLVVPRERAQEVRDLARAAAEGEPDWDALREHDSSGMARVLEDFPRQCREAYSRGKGAELPASLRSFSRILVVGMGGSGIVGDLLARALPEIEVLVRRDYRIPAFIGPETLLIGVSYSGNTEETLSAFEEGLSRTQRALALSSGGKLRELCTRHGIPWLEVPGGYQPRAALGHMLFTLLGALEGLGLKANMDGVFEVLEEESGELSPRNPGNRAQKMARELVGRIPVIYGSHGNTEAIAFRWRTQINENAKQPAFSAVLPELCHNEIVGYEIAAERFPKLFRIFLRTEGDHPRVKLRVEILKEILDRRGLRYTEAWGRGENDLAQAFSLLYLGDWVSYYLALLNRVDPTPVRPIAELKERLSRG